MQDTVQFNENCIEMRKIETKLSSKIVLCDSGSRAHTDHRFRMTNATQIWFCRVCLIAAGIKRNWRKLQRKWFKFVNRQMFSWECFDQFHRWRRPNILQERSTAVLTVCRHAYRRSWTFMIDIHETVGFVGCGRVQSSFCKVQHFTHSKKNYFEPT